MCWVYFSRWSPIERGWSCYCLIFCLFSRNNYDFYGPQDTFYTSDPLDRLRCTLEDIRQLIKWDNFILYSVKLRYGSISKAPLGVFVSGNPLATVTSGNNFHQNQLGGMIRDACVYCPCACLVVNSLWAQTSLVGQLIDAFDFIWGRVSRSFHSKSGMTRDYAESPPVAQSPLLERHNYR